MDVFAAQRAFASLPSDLLREPVTPNASSSSSGAAAAFVSLVSSSSGKPTHIPASFWKDPRTHLASGAALSVILFLVQFALIPAAGKLYRWARGDSSRNKMAGYESISSSSSDTDASATVYDDESLSPEATNKSQSFVDRNGGAFRLAWGLIRLASLVGLVVLATLASFYAHGQKETLIELAGVAFYSYLILLSVLSMTFKPSIRSTFTSVVKGHIVILLLGDWTVFAIRDIFPMATFTISPADNLNTITWARLGLLTFVALAPPLFTPRAYIPLDPSGKGSPTPEQTTSVAALIFFTFLDPFIFFAWKRPAVPFDELPPLGDIDMAQYLRHNLLHQLDPLSKDPRAPKGYRHLGWRIILCWKWEFLLCTVLSGIYTCLEFVAPFAVNRLLAYLEDNDEVAIMKPWFWIAGIGLGPFVQGLTFNYLIYVSTRFMCRCESIITQLIFEHSLRIQLRDDPAKTKGDTEADDTDQSGNLVGRINNLMSSDLDSLINARMIMLDLVSAPLGIAISVIGLYNILGWSSLVGIATLILTTPLPATLAVLQHGTQKKFTEASDARVTKITEAINSLRITKMFGIEENVKNQIQDLRANELRLNRKRKLIGLVMSVTNYTLPLLVMVVTFGVFTVIQGGILTSSKVFSAISVFAIFSQSLSTFFQASRYIESNVSLQRINKFLHNTELIDRYVEGRASPAATQEDPEFIGFRNATFSWITNAASKDDENIRNFRLHFDDLRFQKGKLNVIAGPTGSGKTSLLMALLGEMHYEKTADSSFSLPRTGGVAYADQQSWLQNETLRENILFGSPYDEKRYKAVVHQCALERDFSLFDAGDMTEVGEKGLTLSGGQKARITLARAVYARADILLLDDVLSALDVQTARWIVEKCLGGDVLAGRTVILITHHVHMVSDQAAFLVSMQDGRVKTQGSVNDTLKQDPKLFIEDKIDESNQEAAEAIEVVEGAPDAISDVKPTKDGKLVLAEEKAEGRVSRKAIKLLITSLGGPIFWIVVLGGLIIDQSFILLQTWWLAEWSHQYSVVDDISEISVPYYLLVYCAMVILGVLAMTLGFTVWVSGAVRSGMVIHKKLLNSVFSATLRWLDVTPQGRIISRFTRDMRSIDGEFTELTSSVLDMSITLIVKLAAIAVMVPLFSLTGILVAGFGGLIAELYIHAQLSCKREVSNAKSPLFSHFGDAIAGLVSVRAYGAESKIRKEAIRRVDRYVRTIVIFYNLNRWCNVRFDTLAACFSCSLATYLVYGANLDASKVGFTLAVSVQFSSLILWTVRVVNMWEVAGNSVERVQDYLVIETEKENTPKGVPPAYWPASGDIRIENLSARYSPDSPIVLDSINISIKSGERIGVVGRTGSGKSTLGLALLRLIPTTGDVYIDGINYNELNLDALRRKITIVPQDPTLFSGTLRQNLDPYSEHEDAVLEDALRSSGLTGLSEASAANRAADGTTTPGGHAITLETEISAGGENLSQGQKQLVALARGLVRNSKVVIMDESTASVDFSTDSLIQASIRSRLNGATLITIAHRLRSIMDYDRILVLSTGKVIEFDTPKQLLKNESGHLRALVDASADREDLIEMANGA